MDVSVVSTSPATGLIIHINAKEIQVKTPFGEKVDL